MLMQENTSNDTNTQTNNISCSVTPLFPSLIFQFDVPEYATLLDEVQKLRRQDALGKQASNMGGWHSQLVDIPDLIKQYITFPEWSGVCWYMVNTNLQGNYSHTHPQSDWSGVLWLKVPKDSPAQLEFEHPDCFAQYNVIESVHRHFPDTQEMYNHFQAYAFTPVEGRMLLFPSSLRHRVYFSDTDEERIAMSFNIKLPYG